MKKKYFYLIYFLTRMWCETCFKLFLLFSIYIYVILVSFQRAEAHSTIMSKTFLDADMDAELEEMEKEEGDSDGEEQQAGEAEGKL